MDYGAISLVIIGILFLIALGGFLLWAASQIPFDHR